jgi:hypothetical protein
VLQSLMLTLTVEALSLGSESWESASLSATATPSPRRERNGLGVFASWLRLRLTPRSRGYWECNHEDEDERADCSEVEEAKVKQGDGIGSRYEKKIKFNMTGSRD